MPISRLGRRTARAAAAVPALAMAALGWQSLAGAPAAVSIKDFAFGPTPLTITRGTRVTWTNTDDEPHTVASADDPKLFKSNALDTDDTFSYIFDKAGTFKYYCTIHPRMQGVVVVK